MDVFADSVVNDFLVQIELADICEVGRVIITLPLGVTKEPDPPFGGMAQRVLDPKVGGFAFVLAA